MAELHQKRGLTVSRLRLDCTLMALTLSQLAAFLASSQHSNPSGRTTIWTRIQQQLCHLAVAPAVLFFAVLMQEIGAFGAESEIGLLGKKGRIFGGQDKRTWHYVAHVLEIIVVCTLFRWCASGTPFFTPLVP